MQKLDSIPAFPTLVTELVKLIESPMATTNQIEELLSKDQGLALRALRLANSAFYSVPGGAKTIKRAIAFLGLNAIKEMIVSAAVVDNFKTLDSAEFSLAQFWKHSFGTAIAAQAIAKTIKLDGAEDAFICGLTHDMGKLALLTIDRDHFLSTAILAKAGNKTFYQVEVDSSSPSHTFIGQALAKKWNLSLPMQAVMFNHHSPRIGSRSLPDPEINKMIDLIFLANQAMHQFEFGNSGYDIKPEYNEEVLGRLGLKAGDDQAWVIACKEALKSADLLVASFTS